MAETRALSPEVRGLFDTVRQQAEEYASAFISIERCREDFDTLNSKAAALLNQMHDDVSTALLDLQNGAEGTINSLNEKIRELDEKYIDLGDKYKNLDELSEIKDRHKAMIEVLTDLRAPLPALLARINNEIDKCEIAIREFKDKAYDELNRTLDRLGNKAKSDIGIRIELESRKLESRITLRQKLIEGKLQTVEQTIWAIRDEYSLEIRRINDRLKEFDDLPLARLRDSAGGEDIIAPEGIQAAGLPPAGLITELADRVSKLESMMLDFEIRLQSTLEGRDGPNGADESNLADKIGRAEKRIGELSASLSRMGNDLEESSKKASSAMTAAIIAIILAFIAIILSFAV